MSEIERGNPITGEDNLYRFYKSNLPAVIWNPEKNCPLAEFQNGTFATKSKRVARKLLEMGYPQVSPFAEAPPDIIVGYPGQSIDTSSEAQDDTKIGSGENKNPKPLTPVKTVVE